MEEWCKLEAISIEKGLGYEIAEVDQPEPASRSSAPVYRSIVLVRGEAKKLSEGIDPDGKHYFAALLYWTLDALKEAAIRDTKKLLAIYSASEILRRFAEAQAKA